LERDQPERGPAAGARRGWSRVREWAGPYRVLGGDLRPAAVDGYPTPSLDGPASSEPEAYPLAGS